MEIKSANLKEKKYPKINEMKDKKLKHIISSKWKK